MATVRTVFRCVASRNRERTSRPRAIARTVSVACVTSASTGSVGRRPLRAAVPTTWTSTTPGSSRSISTTVRTAFRCVASRNRERTSRPRTKPPGPPSGPNPLGENITLSSPPLEPRGLLLSVMRQKVGKERIQGGYHPLGHPPLLPELGRNNSSKTPCGRVALPPEIGAGAFMTSHAPAGHPTLSGRI